MEYDGSVIEADFFCFDYDEQSTQVKKNIYFLNEKMVVEALNFDEHSSIANDKFEASFYAPFQLYYELFGDLADADETFECGETRLLALLWVRALLPFHTNGSNLDKFLQHVLDFSIPSA